MPLLEKGNFLEKLCAILPCENIHRGFYDHKKNQQSNQKCRPNNLGKMSGFAWMTSRVNRTLTKLVEHLCFRWWGRWGRTRQRRSCRTWSTRWTPMATAPLTSLSSSPWWPGKWRTQTGHRNKQNRKKPIRERSWSLNRLPYKGGGKHDKNWGKRKDFKDKPWKTRYVRLQCVHAVLKTLSLTNLWGRHDNLKIDWQSISIRYQAVSANRQKTTNCPKQPDRADTKIDNKSRDTTMFCLNEKWNSRGKS